MTSIKGEQTVPAGEAIDPATRRLIWVLVVGGVVPLLDTTIVNVALADLGRSLHTSVATSQWVITGYLLAMGMAMPATQWLSGRFGNKRVWLWCLGVFLAGSALAGASWNITSLIVFRLVQGAAAGVMIPLLTTMLVQAAGRRRLGRVLSIASLLAVVVPVFGPVLGGVIVSGLGWRWVFYVNPPICLAAMWLAWRMLPPDAASRQARSLDVPGLALLSPGLALIIYGLSQAAGARGFAATSAWAPLAGGLALTAAFTVHALRRRRDPLINLRLLRIRSYAASLAVLFLAGVSVYGPLLLIALFYQDVQGKSALIAGLLLAPQGIGSLVPRTIAGKLTDRIGPRPVVLAGLILTAAGTVAFAWAGPATGEWLLAASLFIRGAGLAAVTIAVTAGAFRDIPSPDVPDASSTTRIIQQVGGSFGSAILALILAGALTSHYAATAAASALAFNTAFWWAIAFTAIALIPALLLPAVQTPPAGQDTTARAPGGQPVTTPPSSPATGRRITSTVPKQSAGHVPSRATGVAGQGDQQRKKASSS
jgi:EmrB/QacA subfamily drug resistance transporter